MLRKKVSVFIAAVLLPAAISFSIDEESARVFVGQDLHIVGKHLVSYQLSTGEYGLVFDQGCSIRIGANHFSSQRTVVWLESVTTEFRGRIRVNYIARMYLEGDVSVQKLRGAKAVDLVETIIEEDGTRVVQFGVSGEVFVRADNREVSDPRGLELYNRALKASVPPVPRFVVQPEALVPQLHQKADVEEVVPETAVAEKKVKSREKGIVKRILPPKKKSVKQVKKVAEVKAKEFAFEYPVHISPAGEVEPELESVGTADDGSDIATLRGRFYLWQKQNEQGDLLELQADNAVVFHSGQQLESGQQPGDSKDILGAETAVRAIYLSGDVILTEGRRTIRADEMYYDFQQKKALAVNAEMRNFDVTRGIPIYIRAAKLRQVAKNQFAGENIVVTSSEFHQPQISLTASKVMITDTTTVDEQADKLADNSYDAQMHDVRMKVGKNTIFYWPFLRGNLQRPDTPLKSLSAGHDSIWGTSLETQWYLYRLLGMKEPQGVEGTFALDYFSKRGVGVGTEILYKKENYYGRILGYVIRDSGEDRLGRNRIRRNLKPENELRGRFGWEHRQFLPYKWQLSAGVDYQSDENLLESFYRNEFNTVGRRETYLHLKRIEDNRGISILTKTRINNFRDELEEIPSIEYHLTGQSLFDDKFTLYSDTQISRLRQRIGKDHNILIDENMFSFVSHRTELDLPFRAGSFKIVPFMAGTFGYDDRSGFTTTLVNGSNSGEFGKENIVYGEAGLRVSAGPVWKLYPNVISRVWNLNKLRHIIKPYLKAVLYGKSDNVVDQSNMLNMGITQRLQTKRGPAGEQRTVDWMRLDTDVTLVDSSSDPSTNAPDRFIWAKPFVPLRVLSAPDIFNGDFANNLQRFEMFGPRRDYIGADYIWRLSDTSMLLSDLNFDMQSGVVQQFNIGFSRLCWPNLSYYIGSRYLRRIQVFDEKGSNAFTFAATYVLDPRYTLVFAQQFDFDYGANVRSDITLIRKYHRINCSFTYSADESLDRQAIVFGIWPQGVPELAIGRSKYAGIGNAPGY